MSDIPRAVKSWDVDECPGCGHVFPEIVAVGCKPDTVSGITEFAVCVECPACLVMSTITVSVEEMSEGEEPPFGVPPPAKPREPSN